MQIRHLFCVAFLFSLFGAGRAIAQQPPASLQPYAHCSLPDGLKVVHVDSLPPGINSRDVDTETGTRRIDLEAGMRVMFAYPDTDFYANVKAETIPASKYAKEKPYLLENLQHLAHGNTVNTAQKSPLNGFEAHGIDREKLEGGVLGIYLLFDDARRTVTTIYLLNQQPEARKFKTIEEYRTLRDQFLAGYTQCIQSNIASSR